MFDFRVLSVSHNKLRPNMLIQPFIKKNFVLTAMIGERNTITPILLILDLSLISPRSPEIHQNSCLALVQIQLQTEKGKGLGNDTHGF